MKAEITNERDMYIRKCDDLGTEAQREVFARLDAEKERDQLKAQLDEAVKIIDAAALGGKIQYSAIDFMKRVKGEK